MVRSGGSRRTDTTAPAPTAPRRSGPSEHISPEELPSSACSVYFGATHVGPNARPVARSISRDVHVRVASRSSSPVPSSPTSIAPSPCSRSQTTAPSATRSSLLPRPSLVRTNPRVAACTPHRAHPGRRRAGTDHTTSPLRASTSSTRDPSSVARAMDGPAGRSTSATLPVRRRDQTGCRTAAVAGAKSGDAGNAGGPAAGGSGTRPLTGGDGGAAQATAAQARQTRAGRRSAAFISAGPPTHPITPERRPTSASTALRGGHDDEREDLRRRRRRAPRAHFDDRRFVFVHVEGSATVPRRAGDA
jgi:hypothetical protein